MMVNPVVRARIRRLINVESGLNDGIATPFVSVALAGAATGGQVTEHGPAAAAAELAAGIVVGVAAGGAAAFAGGLAFGTTGGRHGEPLVPFVEETGALVSVLVWLAFGAVALVPATKTLTWAMVSPPRIAPSPSPCCSASSHTVRRPNRWRPGTRNCWPIAPPAALAPLRRKCQIAG